MIVKRIIAGLRVECIRVKGKRTRIVTNRSKG